MQVVHVVLIGFLPADHVTRSAQLPERQHIWLPGIPDELACNTSEATRLVLTCPVVVLHKYIELRQKRVHGSTAVALV